VAKSEGPLDHLEDFGVDGKMTVDIPMCY